MAVLPEERRLVIRDLVARSPVVRADELAERFGVSVETIRRDLSALEQAGHTRRVYGGAIPTIPHRSEAPFEQRRLANARQKRAMARLAAALVEPDDMLVFDVGTSVAEVATHLAPSFRGRVITNSILAVAQLAGRPGVEVHVSGGRVRPGDLACFGSRTEAFFAGFYGGKAFLGSGGVHPEAGLTDYYPDEVPSRHVMLDRADERYVLADSSKLGQIAPIYVCALDRLTGIITDDGVDDAVAGSFERSGLRLLVATVEEERTSSAV